MAGSAVVMACEVITEAELEGILGLDLEPGRTTNVYERDSSCRWNLPGDAQRGVSISLYQRRTLEAYERVPGAVHLSGIGDAAIWNPTVGQLAVRHGESLVSIGLLIDNPQRSHAERIAGVVDSRQ